MNESLNDDEKLVIESLLKWFGMDKREIKDMGWDKKCRKKSLFIYDFILYFVRIVYLLIFINVSISKG